MSQYLERLNLTSCPPLRPGEEWWTAPSHQMTIQIRKEERRRAVIVLRRGELRPGIHYALVRRIRPRQRPLRRRMIVIGVSVGMPPLAAWSMVRLWPIVLAAVACWIAWKVCARERSGPACAGLHCPGCGHH